MREWLQKKIDFCKEHTFINLCAKINEVCEITLYLMDNKDKVYKEHSELERQLFWLKKHQLPTEVIKDKCIEIT